MKKFLAITLSAVLALSLAACGGASSSTSTASTADSTSAASTAAEDKDLTFGYIAYDMSDIWNEYSARAFEYAAEQNGVETVVLDSKNSLEESITAMESLIQQGVDGISIFPISTEQGAQLVKMANEAGIPVYGSEIEQVKIGCVASAGLDYVQLGIQTGLMAAKVLTGEATCEDLPYETISEYQIYINSQELDAMGIAVPEALADKAIEATAE